MEMADTYGEFDVLENLIQRARQGYFKAAEALRARFMEAVAKEGWPVSGKLCHAEVFDRFEAPWLVERQKVAYFMVDALRYELAAELEKELSSHWKTELAAACAQLPTITPVGMAALMPGADGKLPEPTQLLVVKTTDIDTLAEDSALEVIRLIPRLTKKIVAGVNKTRKMGYDHAALVTDHGFVLFDAQQAGDVVPKPQGEWGLVKTRCLLGKCAIAEKVQAFGKNEVGIAGDLEDYVVPRSFGTFSKGNPYAHGGLSLQECLLPVIAIDFERKGAETFDTAIDIRLSCKGGATNKITTRRPMIEVSMFQTMFGDTVEFHLEAYAGKEVVGEAAASPHVNAATNLVSIKPGQAFKVPLKMEDDFHGSFEVRAVDPATQVNYATLKLKHH